MNTLCKINILLLAAMLVVEAHSADTVWKASSERTDNSWATDANWSDGVPTTENGNNAILNAGGTIDFGSTPYAISSVGWTNPDELTFTASDANGGLTIGDDLSVARVKGTDSECLVKFLKGTYSFGSLSVGYFSWDWGRTGASIGRVAIQDSSVTTTGDVGIGLDGGNGTITVGSCGILSAAAIRIAQGPCWVWDSENNRDSNVVKFPATGVLNVEEDASVTSRGGTFSVGAGKNATGSVVQTGGDVTLTENGWVAVGDGDGATGTYKISGGTLKTTGNSIVIGRTSGGTGVMTISGDAVVEAGAANAETGHRNDVIFCESANTTGTLNLDGGTLKCNIIRVANGDSTSATLNCNGGTIESAGWYIIIDKTNGMTVNVKAGGLVVDVPEGKEVNILSALIADESLGGIVKKGKGKLQISNLDVDNVCNFKVSGYLKVEEGTLDFWGTTVNALDKVVVAENATLDFRYGLPEGFSVRSVKNNGTIISASNRFVAMENPPALTKAVWTGARSEDVTDPANWALYYDDNGTDVRVSADELPTADTTIYYNASLGDTLPDLTDLTFKEKILVLPNETVTVAVNNDGTLADTYDLGDWKLDASAATLHVTNVRHLAANTAVVAITSAGIVGEFAAVTGDGNQDVRPSYADGNVSIVRAGGLLIIIR